ncbi:MAG: LysR family transcriptional regulator [Pirellulales bacterium]|nr:LysR family transcriptional regulator [Pirellulales bacterium]
MDIEALRIFCSVVRNQSVSLGASAHRISQSAATQRIKRLEEHFGCKLLDRQRRPFALTPAGRLCYQKSQEILDRYDAMEGRLRALSAEVAGNLRVAAIYSVGLYTLRESIEQFMRKYPKVNVRLEYRRPGDVYETVFNDGVHVGIVSYPLASGQLNVVPLADEEMVLVCHPKHRLAGRDTVDVRDLAGEDYVAFERDLPIRKETDRFFEQHGIQVNPVMEFDNVETVKDAVEIDAGVSVLPEPTVRKEVRSGRLAAARLLGGNLCRPLGLIHRDRKTLPTAALKFIEVVARESPAGDGGK